jgi:hypothetical protein
MTGSPPKDAVTGRVSRGEAVSELGVGRAVDREIRGAHGEVDVRAVGEGTEERDDLARVRAQAQGPRGEGRGGDQVVDAVVVEVGGVEDQAEPALATADGHRGRVDREVELGSRGERTEEHVHHAHAVLVGGAHREVVLPVAVEVAHRQPEAQLVTGLEGQARGAVHHHVGGDGGEIASGTGSQGAEDHVHGAGARAESVGTRSVARAGDQVGLTVAVQVGHQHRHAEGVTEARPEDRQVGGGRGEVALLAFGQGAAHELDAAGPRDRVGAEGVVAGSAHQQIAQAVAVQVADGEPGGRVAAAAAEVAGRQQAVRLGTVDARVRRVVQEIEDLLGEGAAGGEQAQEEGEEGRLHDALPGSDEGLIDNVGPRALRRHAAPS